MTSWKQWIHLRRSDFWPPTSIMTSFFLGVPVIAKCISEMPIVRARAKMMSCGGLGDKLAALVVPGIPGKKGGVGNRRIEASRRV